MELFFKNSPKAYVSRISYEIRLTLASPTIWIAILFTFFFLIQVRLDPDPHHDGIIFTSGLAFSEGLLPNKDFFSQYGPIHVAVSGWNLLVLGKAVLSLRILTAIFLASTASIMFLLIRQKKSDLLAFGVSAYWCLSCPTFILAATTPWPTVLTTLISLIIILVIGDGSRNQLLISLLICLGTLCRIQFAAVGAFIFFVILFKNWQSNRILVKKWSLALTTSLSLSTVLLIFFGILPRYIEETIFWSFGTYGRNSITLDSAGILKIIALMWIPLITVFAYSIRRFLSVRKYFPFFLTGLVVVTISNFLFSFNLVNPSRSSFYSIVFVLEYATRNIVESGLFLTVGVVVFRVIKTFKTLFKSALKTQDLLSLCVALTAILQLFPQWDLMHIWWVSPIFLTLTSQWFTFGSRSLVGVLICLIGLGGIQTAGYLLEPRFAYSDSVLLGMFGKQEIVGSVGETLLSLENSGDGMRIEFNCDHAIYAGFGGKYHSSSHSYVSWGAGFLEPNQTKQGTFYCNIKSGSPILNLVASKSENFAIRMPDDSWNVFITDPQGEFLDSNFTATS